ncbi:tRNA uridine-5-carboxymethylaminomethyl(34) synthesis enzyme MnmG [Isachenkonia alkalipeptolytica]|uniref:tRNA uridine 5-carboxymethylaminomethyl modification enzyme MnmG n=1 Tax=Isachenkonia alkalipeptolytica TaxID=2565777 RepID=A0AA44BFT9_9CLOT|nr:tRNA uridine-5-carboxymethylaminomethyl(34) synthesis enzyme MnmG [Isachenkonia alkalipeptolytica]NBG89220.1 tRNA uridine-5-carboxymethylaminomethyl(34) synthesis enzyme MnmG [Isachenkonia alkalipeptolytica]
MNYYHGGNYDVVVVGAGHAGCEAALAAARLGLKTLVLTISLESVAMMACNPSIGGTGKGHLVREVDALGGEMGLNTDKTFIQSKMLNTGKGPAVHSLRAQADKLQYHLGMKQTLEDQENLTLKQGDVIDLIMDQGKVRGVKTRNGAAYDAKTVILATGVYLKSRIFMGEVNYESGPDGLATTRELPEKLRSYGCNMRRFKTGTPARIHGSSVDYGKMTEQEGDAKTIPFSFLSEALEIEQISCWLTRTTEETKRIIEENIYRSSMYRGDMESVGPRYCPSIEDKIVRFTDKPTHQLFLEPEGVHTREMYLQGMSSSLPEEIQVAMIRSVTGLEKAEIMRPAYAIEYDCIDPTDLQLTLETKSIENLYSAGQFNGSSGYEEAAAQGLVAGINASMKILGKEPLILDRSEAYIGVLIDDLVTKGTNEPYRMMTSRAEYRLVLRQDNADLRLTQKGYDLGLVQEERYNRLLIKKAEIEKELQGLKKKKITPGEVNPILEEIGSSKIETTLSFYDLLKRPEINYQVIEPLYPESKKLMADVKDQCEVIIKYDGYIKKQLRQIEQFKKLENKRIPDDVVYDQIDSLRKEAKQKLESIRPHSVGQASRISGVSPADISVLLVYLEQRKRGNRNV